MNEPLRFGALGAILAALAAAGPIGCEGGKFGLPGAEPWEKKPERADIAVPEPIHLLLPQAIRIHPFTGMRTFDETGGVKGIDVRIEALDAYGDPTKAFGKFQFTLYQFRTDSPNHRGPRIATWEEDLLAPKQNLVHWDNITRTYVFKLQWFRAIPVGSKFLLVASFDSPFTQRKFAERDFISGQ